MQCALNKLDMSEAIIVCSLKDKKKDLLGQLSALGIRISDSVQVGPSDGSLETNPNLDPS